MANVFIPFNHQPDSIQRQASTYTCPSGFYARCTYNWVASVRATKAATTVAGTNLILDLDYTPSSESGTFSIWIHAGDKLDVGATAASGSVTHQTSATENTYSYGAHTSQVTLDLTPSGGSLTTIFSHDSYGQSVACVGPVSGAPNLTLYTIGGTAVGYLIIEQYRVVGA
jgi:hypothetical protein